MLGFHRRRVIQVIAVVASVLLAHQLWARVRLATSIAEPAGPQAAAEEPERHPVMIRRPTGPHGVATGLAGYDGEPATVSCATCHTTRAANVENRIGSDLDEFHQGLSVAHGNLACVACHNADDGYESLHLADGRSVAWADSMTLCAQCHGPQFRDYQHGSHGGMTGFWDLKRGPRMRNHCVDCHDPHAPAFPAVRPAAGPADRFAPARQETDH